MPALTARTFPANIEQRRTGVFSQGFNTMAGRRLDAAAFFAEAERQGWHDARIFPPGRAAAFEKSRLDTRITAVTDASGTVTGFRHG